MNFPDAIKRLARDIYHLFFPPVCPVCGSGMPEGAGFMCTSCRLEIPLTRFCEVEGNPVRERLSAQLPVKHASSFFYYIHDSPYRVLIHRFKYSGGWKTARDMGEWFGSCLAESGLYNDVDYIVPVPLHRRKLRKRGYNQSEYIAHGISKYLDKPVCAGNLLRIRYGRSQTTVSGSQRWVNVKGAFSVRDPEVFRGKHILLVDDVLTTGSTLISCGDELLKAVEEIEISIVTLGVAE